MSQRTFHESKPEGYYSLLNDDILVVCPRCACGAFAKGVGIARRPEPPRLVCTHCGYSRSYPRYGGFGIDHRWGPYVGECRTGAALWLQTACCGETLWAMNERHLNWLADYVQATLRTVSRTEQGYSNHALQSRIPKWISSGANRPKVMAGIEKLRCRLEEHSPKLNQVR